MEPPPSNSQAAHRKPLPGPPESGRPPSRPTRTWTASAIRSIPMAMWSNFIPGIERVVYAMRIAIVVDVRRVPADLRATIERALAETEEPVTRTEPAAGRARAARRRAGDPGDRVRAVRFPHRQSIAGAGEDPRRPASRQLLRSRGRCCRSITSRPRATCPSSSGRWRPWPSSTSVWPRAGHDWRSSGPRST